MDHPWTPEFSGRRASGRRTRLRSSLCFSVWLVLFGVGVGGSGTGAAAEHDNRSGEVSEHALLEVLGQGGCLLDFQNQFTAQPVQDSDRLGPEHARPGTAHFGDITP
jgi:hypothetical protein